MRALKTLIACACTAVAMSATAGPLNDTGIDFCLDPVTEADIPVTATTTCAPSAGRQDARFGRDPAAARGLTAKVGGGGKGFDFTKIANNGTALSASAVLGPNPGDWACTRDNNTGLIWEVKTTDGGLRDRQWTYSWYDSVHNYGGNAGTANGGTCLTAGHCDTEKFVADVNTGAGLCGHIDWRMPTNRELQSIVDYGIARPAATIDPTYFPNTGTARFWSGSPARIPVVAWTVDFESGAGYWVYRSDPYRVRLVRTGQ